MPFLNQNNAPAPLLSTATTKYLYNQVEQKTQSGNPRKRQRQIGTSSSFTPSGQHFVVLSIPHGIAHRKRCTVATSPRQMAVSI